MERCKAGRHRVVIEEAHFDFRSPSKTKFPELKTQIKVTRGRPRPYWTYYLLYEIVHNIELDMDWSKKRSAERYLKHDAPNLIHGQPGPKQGVFEMIFTKIGKSKLLRRHSLKIFTSRLLLRRRWSSNSDEPMHLVHPCVCINDVNNQRRFIIDNVSTIDKELEWK